MKKFRKIVSFVLTMIMCLSLGTVAFAAAGDFTITIQNATVGETYSAYKIFDASYDEQSGGVSYTISEKSPLYESISALTDVFVLLANSNDAATYYVTIKDGVSDADVIAAIESLPIEDLVTPSASKTADSTTLTLDVGEPGYYYVTTTTGSAVTVTTTDPAATVIDKNEVVGEDFYKFIVDKDGNLIQYDDAAFGDKLNFDITSDVPRYEGSKPVIEYEFTDTLSDDGLEIVIEVGTDFSNGDIYVENGHYYAGENLINEFVSFTDSNGQTYTLSDVAYNYTLEFTDVTYDAESGYIVCGGFILTYYTYEDDSLSSSKYPTDLSIDITYTTYVTDYGNHFEANTAMLRYWVMGPEDTPTPGENSGTTSTDHVYNWDLKIRKTDGSDGTRRLEGATFTLYGTNLIDVNVRSDYNYILITRAEMEEGATYYYLLADGRWTTTDFTNETRSQYDPDNPGPYVRDVKYSEIRTSGADRIVQGTTGNDGLLIFDGLTEGTYILTEIVSPEGYNLLEDPITITIGFDSETGTFYVENIFGIGVGTGEFDVNNELEIIVMNKAGTQLPSTGGMGTTIFYVIGAVLVCGAVVLLILRRRRNHVKQ